MSFGKSVLSVAALSAAFAAGVVASRATDHDSNLEARVEPPASVVSAPQTRATATSRPSGAAAVDLSDVAEEAVRASVNISSTAQVQVADPMMRFLYGQDVMRSQTSLGSGVLVSSDGLVLTNSHVVQSMDAQIKVSTADNRELPARIRGIDYYTDLAVLQIDAKGLTPLPWGDSSKLRVAEWVLAVGNPFAFNQTVTQGIVSAVNRHDPQRATYTDYIQTDAAINPGNSGGPLINARGELIGINTMIYSGNGTGTYDGVGFAIPANLARGIMTELVKNGSIVRGWIGNLTLTTVSAEQARRGGLGEAGGVLLYTLYRSDPAVRAGMLPGDLIVSFNKKPVAEPSQLQKMIAEAPIGSTATLLINRRGDLRTIEVPISRAPNQPNR